MSNKIILNFLIIASVLALSGNAWARSRAAERLSVLDRSFSSDAGYQIAAERREDVLAASPSAGVWEPPAEQPVTAEGNEVPSEAARFFSGFSHTTVYKDNVYRTRIDPKGDLIEAPTATLGVVIGREGGTLYFENAYDLTYLDYVEDDKLSAWSHLNYTRIDVKGDKWFAGFENEFRPLSPRESGDRRELTSSASGAAATSTSDRAELTLDWSATSRSRLQGAWVYTYHLFPSSAGDNTDATERLSYQEHVWTPRVLHDLTPKTSLYAEYEFAHSDYFRSGLYSAVSTTPRAGLIWRVTPKTTLIADAGWLERDFDLPEIEDGGEFVFKGVWAYQPGPKTRFSLFGGRDSAVDTDFLGASPLTQSANRTDLYLGGRGSWATGPNSSLSGHVSTRWSEREGDVRLEDPDEAGVIRSGARRDYPFEWGVDWMWDHPAGARYRLGFKHVRKNSNFDNFDYEDYQLIGGVSWQAV
jgi:hypothetical protein